MQSNFVNTNHIKLHYLDSSGDKPILVLTHGLTANSHAFDGLIRAGLTDHVRLISPDLRGRGQSDQPVEGYSMKEHAADILGLMDDLGIEQCHFGGHSFGGLLGIYMAVKHPERVDKLVLLDAGSEFHEKVREMLVPTMGRLGQVYESKEFYINKVRNAPYLPFWDEAMESYYQADIRVLEDGKVIPIPTVDGIAKAINEGSFGEPWPEYIPQIEHETILINGTGNYVIDAPLLPVENAKAAAQAMKNCKYVAVDGNHQTMLYGEGAVQMVEALGEFLG